MECSFLVFIPRTGLDPQVGQFQPAGHKFGTPAAFSQVNASLFGHLDESVYSTSPCLHTES